MYKHKINMDNFSNVKNTAAGIAENVEKVSETHVKGRFRKGKKEFEGLELI